MGQLVPGLWSFHPDPLVFKGLLLSVRERTSCALVLQDFGNKTCFWRVEDSEEEQNRAVGECGCSLDGVSKSCGRHSK